MIITRSPLRISLGGGGTDLPSYYRQHTGFLIAAAIDKYVYITLHQTFVQDLIIKYSKLERVNNIKEIQHPIIREALALLNVPPEYLEISSMADIPAGTGLGSSGSFTTAILKAFHTFQKNLIHPQELAEQACDIEINRLGEPIGKQDQYIAAYGGLRHFEFAADDSVIIKTPEITDDFFYELGLHLMLFFTGKTRKSEEILVKQKKNISHCEKILKRMTAQSFEVLEAFNKGNLRFLSQTLEEGWELKKKLAGGISNSLIDKMYNLSKKAGALGGKIVGAGGGGFLLLYVPLGKQENVRKALSSYRELKFNLDRDGSKPILNIRR